MQEKLKLTLIYFGAADLFFDLRYNFYQKTNGRTQKICPLF